VETYLMWRSRPYVGVEDLRALQAATAKWIAEAGFSGYLHIEDVAYRLFNGMRRYDPRNIIRLWEDEKLLGWAMVYPRWNSYEALLHPAFRSGVLAEEILDWAEKETLLWLQKEGKGSESFSVNVFEGDSARIALLEKRSYVRGEQHGIIAVRSLDEVLPDVELPAGFTARPLAGEHEVDKLVEAMNAAFDWTWKPDDFRDFMQSPGYNVQQQMVVVAADGRFAAFCYLMLDKRNALGMVEDVGTHPAFRRMGLGRALLFAGMRQMKAAGMDTALVPYGMELSAAPLLYQSAGFKPLYNIFSYDKTSPTHPQAGDS
jgi:GNAT superfamily N-acetyltransferase